jgi:hypothetical protein
MLTCVLRVRAADQSTSQLIVSAPSEVPSATAQDVVRMILVAEDPEFSAEAPDR